MSKLLLVLSVLTLSFTAQAGINKGNECQTLESHQITALEKVSEDQTKIAPLSISKVKVKCIGNTAKIKVKISTESIRDINSDQIVNGGFGFKAQAQVLDQNMNVIDQKQTHHYFFLSTTLKNGAFLKITIEGFSPTLISL